MYYWNSRQCTDLENWKHNMNNYLSLLTIRYAQVFVQPYKDRHYFKVRYTKQYFVFLKSQNVYASAFLRSSTVCCRHNPFFRNAWRITRFVTRITRWVPTVEQNMITLLRHLYSPPVFVTLCRSIFIVFCVVLYR